MNANDDTKTGVNKSSRFDQLERKSDNLQSRRAFLTASGLLAATGAVTSGTEGPGFTNLISGLANAKAARTPVLFIASNKSVREEDAEVAIQLMEQESVTSHMVKWQKRLVNAHRNHEYAAYAFRQLKTGVPSPVHLNFTAEAGDEKLKKPGDIAY